MADNFIWKDESFETKINVKVGGGWEGDGDKSLNSSFLFIVCVFFVAYNRCKSHVNSVVKERRVQSDAGRPQLGPKEITPRSIKGKRLEPELMSASHSARFLYGGNRN